MHVDGPVRYDTLSRTRVLGVRQRAPDMPLRLAGRTHEPAKQRSVKQAQIKVRMHMRVAVKGVCCSEGGREMGNSGGWIGRRRGVVR